MKNYQNINNERKLDAVFKKHGAVFKKYGAVFCLLMIIFLLWGGVLFSQPIDKIVAVIDEAIILDSDIKNQYDYYLKNGQKDDGTLRCTVFENMLTSKLLLAKAKLDSLVVSDEQVEGELNRRVDYMIAQMGSQAEFEKFNKKTLLETKLELRPKIKEQLLVEQQKNKIFNNIKITPKDIKEFYQSLPDDSLPFLPSEVEIKQILIKPKPTAEAKKEAKEKLENIRKQILDGETELATQAKLYSDDPSSAKQGGLLPPFGHGQMTPEFEEFAFSMNVGDLSPVFETPYGYHILSVLEKTTETVKASHILIRPQITKGDENKTIEELKNIRDMVLRDSITFEKAAQKYSQDPQSKDNGGTVTNQKGESNIPLDQLDAGLYFTIDPMGAGEISEPKEFISPQLGPDKYFQILYLKKRTLPHKANLKEDYPKFHQVTTQAKQAEALDEWFQNAKKQVFIEIKDQSCSQALENWKWGGYFGLFLIFT